MKLQKLGRALMLPIAVFPAAALLMGIGYALEESGMENLYFMAMILQKTGNVIISQTVSYTHLNIVFKTGNISTSRL